MPNGRIARWQTLISEYNFSIKYMPGKEKVVADFLSRMNKIREEEIELEDPRDKVMLINRDPESSDSRTAPREEELKWNIEETRRLQDEIKGNQVVKSMLKEGKTVVEIERIEEVEM